MRIRTISLAVAVLASTACAGVQAGERPDGTSPGGLVFTQADVQRVGARDAMDLLERTRHFLDIRQGSNGETRRITSRGVASLVIDAQVIVVVNGAHVADAIGALRSIPGTAIARVEILNAREATPRYGTGGGNGAIIVTTSADLGG